MKSIICVAALAALSAALPQAPPAGAQVWDFTQGIPSVFANTGSVKATTDGSRGAVFTITNAGDSVFLDSAQGYGKGTYSALIQSTGAEGVVNYFTLKTADGDEVTYEFLGGAHDDRNAGNAVQTNVFQKGKAIAGANERLIKGIATDQGFHSYSVTWSDAAITLQVDSLPPLTVPTTVNGQTFPDGPFKVHFGAWIGCPNKQCMAAPDGPFVAGGPCGDDSNVGPGTCRWMNSVFQGGSAATMYVKSATFKPL